MSRFNVRVQVDFVVEAPDEDEATMKAFCAASGWTNSDEPMSPSERFEKLGVRCVAAELMGRCKILTAEEIVAKYGVKT